MNENETIYDSNNTNKNGAPPPPPSFTPTPEPFKPEPKKEKSKDRGCFFFIAIFSILGFLGVIAVFVFLIGILFIGGSTALSTFNPFPPYNEEFFSGDHLSFDKIVIIEVNGVILSGNSSSPMYSVADASEICRQLKYISRDSSVKGIVLDINSPGGEVVASDVIHHQIQKLQRENGIPIVASMGSIATSGAYYISAPCDYIVANRMTLTGSIGVIIQTYKYYDLFKKIGLGDEVIKSGKMKDILNGARPTTPAERAIVQQLINNTYDEFVQIVADGREKLTVDKIKNTKVGDGRIFDGEEALQLGLVDQLGFIDDAIAKTAEMAKLKTYKAVRYKMPFSLAQLFTGAQSSSKDINVNLPGVDKHARLTPGKMYFLPAFSGE
jgi:protease-4